VCNVSTRVPKHKVRVIPIIRVALARAGQRLFTGSDTRARNHGWQISLIHGGLGRRYRDPRFDALVRGPACGPAPGGVGRA
jgi:hypothetical protein